MNCNFVKCVFKISKANRVSERFHRKVGNIWLLYRNFWICVRSMELPNLHFYHYFQCCDFKKAMDFGIFHRFFAETQMEMATPQRCVLKSYHQISEVHVML